MLSDNNKEMFFEENFESFPKKKKNYDEIDELMFDKLRKGEINADETIKNLEKNYKGITMSLLLFLYFTD